MRIKRISAAVALTAAGALVISGCAAGGGESGDDRDENGYQAAQAIDAEFLPPAREHLAGEDRGDHRTRDHERRQAAGDRHGLRQAAPQAAERPGDGREHGRCQERQRRQD